MRIIILLVVSIVLTTNLCSGQSEFKKRFFGQINLSHYTGFNSTEQSQLLYWEQSSFTTWNLGLGYEYYRSQKWNISTSASIGWVKDREKTTITDPNFNQGNELNSISSSGSDIYFIFETRFVYNNLVGENFSGYIAPTFNYRLFNDVGKSGTNGENLVTGYNFRRASTYENRIIRPSLTVGLTYKFKTQRKMTLSAFYSHSFTPITFGEWEYSNSLGDQTNGNWKLNGHQIGLSFQIFPFFKRNSN